MSGWLRAASLALFMAAMWLPQLGLKLNFSKPMTMISVILMAILFALWEVSERIKEATHDCKNH